MQNIDINHNQTKHFYEVVKEVFGKYELYDSYYILNGIDLVGVENYKFWLSFVEYIKKTTGLENLPNYILLMEKLEHEDLIEFIEKIQNKNNFPSFEDSYLEFIALLSKVSEIKIRK